MGKQNRRKFLATSVLAGAALSVNAASPFREKNKLIHHVFFWLKNPGSKEDLEKLITGLKTLRRIKTVRKLHIGLPAATEKRDVVESGYQVSELMFFDDLPAQKAYQDDPIHQQFIKDCAHLWSKVVVYDVQQVD